MTSPISNDLQSLAADLAKEAEGMRAQAAMAMRPLEPFFAKVRDYFSAHAAHLEAEAKAKLDAAEAAQAPETPPTGN